MMVLIPLECFCLVILALYTVTLNYLSFLFLRIDVFRSFHMRGFSYISLQSSSTDCHYYQLLGFLHNAASGVVDELEFTLRSGNKIFGSFGSFGAELDLLDLS
eukprot:TRINITY_DN266_c0_g1_i4.p2 TRINITY_DN266_c0_g1~~TRINITY_DN266_c0_g1_i4.p2  ORF type:complete len:103 (-),score=13.37 TRINITY_DN266_c0_g1_i4:93-401(-)